MGVARCVWIMGPRSMKGNLQKLCLEHLILYDSPCCILVRNELIVYEFVCITYLHTGFENYKRDSIVHRLWYLHVHKYNVTVSGKRDHMAHELLF